MNYLELVQRAVEESQAKLEVPTTTVGATNLAARFCRWTTSAWKKIQLERLGWHFRVVTDQTIALVADTPEYSLPSTLESINTRTAVTYATGINKGPLYFRPSDVYRSQVLSKDDQLGTGRPRYFTLLPTEGQIAVWPTPDQAYTMEFEGQRRLQLLEADADIPTGLHEDYHEAIVWQAVMKYAIAFEDGAKLQEAQGEFMPYKRYFEERYMDIPVVDTTALYTSVYPYDA